MPMTSAARRASRASSSVQQPRAPVRYDDSARWPPAPPSPPSPRGAAAVAESTPPDIAASTRRPLIGQKPTRRQPPLPACGAAAGLAGGGAAGAGYGFADHQGQGVHVAGGGGVAQGETQRAAGAGVVGAH